MDSHAHIADIVTKAGGTEGESMGSMAQSGKGELEGSMAHAAVSTTGPEGPDGSVLVYVPIYMPVSMLGQTSGSPAAAHNQPPDPPAGYSAAAVAAGDVAVAINSSSVYARGYVATAADDTDDVVNGRSPHGGYYQHIPPSQQQQQPTPAPATSPVEVSTPQKRDLNTPPAEHLLESESGAHCSTSSGSTGRSSAGKVTAGEDACNESGGDSG